MNNYRFLIVPFILFSTSCGWNSIDDNFPPVLGNYYQRNREDVQLFTLNADAGGTITGKEGTVLNFPPNAFWDEKGNITAGDVEIRLKEFYDLKEMFKSNVHTASYDNMLVSGGSLYFDAQQNGKAIRISPLVNVTGTMPVKTKANGLETAMSAYTGKPIDDNGNSLVDWIGTQTVNFSSGIAEDVPYINYGYDSLAAIPKYDIQLLQIGWTNCDVFANVQGPKTQFKVKVNGAIYADVFMFVKGVTSLIKVYTKEGDYYQTYENMIPVGTEATLFVVSEWHNKIRFGSKEIKVNGDDVYEVQINPGTEEEMETAVKAIRE